MKCQEDCFGGGGGGTPAIDSFPTAPGYWDGATFTPSRCLSPSGTNINDVDYHGMDDYCEQHFAEQFAPGLALAPSNYDCDASGEPSWAAKYFPAQGNIVRIA
jgi:hypothetical protein